MVSMKQSCHNFREKTHMARQRCMIVKSSVVDTVLLFSSYSLSHLLHLFRFCMNTLPWVICSIYHWFNNCRNTKLDCFLFNARTFHILDLCSLRPCSVISYPSIVFFRYILRSNYSNRALLLLFLLHNQRLLSTGFGFSTGLSRTVLCSW
jgi:hypothetical protein